MRLIMVHWQPAISAFLDQQPVYGFVGSTAGGGMEEDQNIREILGIAIE